jgi:hypothetical protein
MVIHTGLLDTGSFNRADRLSNPLRMLLAILSPVSVQSLGVD